MLIECEARGFDNPTDPAEVCAVRLRNVCGPGGYCRVHVLVASRFSGPGTEAR